MIPHSRSRAALPARGFTLVEMMIVIALTGFLFLMVSGVWTGLGRSMSDSISHGRVVAEANLALESLRRDLAGSQPGDLTGTIGKGRVVGRVVVGDNQLKLCFDSGLLNGSADWAPPDRVVTYRVQDDQLCRIDESTGTTLVVADGVSGFTVTDQGDGVTLQLTVTRRDFSRTHTLVTQDP